MTKEEFFEMGDRPRFIPGIYNYCDRWCERCAFTARCRTFATMNQTSPDEENPAIEMEDFLAELEQELAGTKEEINELVEEMESAAQDISDEEMEEFKAERDRVHREAEEQPIAKDSRAYYEMVDEWLAVMKSQLKEKNIDLESEASREKPNTEREEGKILDALQIVLWFQHFIHVKLMRSLTSFGDERDDDPEMEEYPKDADGSVKIALIAMDKSINAWNQLQEHFP
ncbi:MAG: hypothetical protein AAB344_03510, partial [Bacteroidota bacterium]